MKIAIFTQDERLYLPNPIAHVVAAMPERVSCILVSPPMSTHGGTLRGLMRHLAVFGLRGTAIMAGRLAGARLGPALGLRPRRTRYWSMKEIGEAFGVPHFRVQKVNSRETRAILDRHPAELLVSVSCPQIIRRKTLRRFERGGINVHSAPLPRYRGLLPSFWVLYHGEPQTAVTVHELAEKLDNGRILLQRPVAIADGETWDSLVCKTKEAAGQALVEAIRRIEEGTVEARPNPDDESTYFSFPTWKDARAFRARGGRMF
jgi:methionyl-tRNA formyltransferase